MQDREGAPSSKADQQRLVLGLVQRLRLGTQRELQGALAAAGCRVTQATVSRDIRELGLEKERDALGGFQSEIGSAPAIARALDRVRHPLVVGTLAGDDTCLVVAPDERTAEAVARDLGDAIG